MGGIFRGIGDNCEILMFIILFLLLFFDRGEIESEAM